MKFSQPSIELSRSLSHSMDETIGRTRQCAKCPWKKSTDPRTIPNGYSAKLHARLSCTIARPGDLRGSASAMACHESPPGKEQMCIGWLVNQLGPGNNIALRLWAIRAQPKIELDGEQHERFEDTLPKRKRRHG
jgi:hypothetical protein